jgi:hypothetical protein
MDSSNRMTRVLFLSCQRLSHSSQVPNLQFVTVQAWRRIGLRMGLTNRAKLGLFLPSILFL